MNHHINQGHNGGHNYTTNSYDLDFFGIYAISTNNKCSQMILIIINNKSETYTIKFHDPNYFRIFLKNFYCI